MDRKRVDIIKEKWKLVHGRFVPMFRWRNHESMRYVYDENDDSIKCDCGVGITLDLPTDQITENTLKEEIRRLEYKVYRTFKDNYNVDLGIDD